MPSIRKNDRPGPMPIGWLVSRLPPVTPPVVNPSPTYPKIRDYVQGGVYLAIVITLFNVLNQISFLQWSPISFVASFIPTRDTTTYTTHTTSNPSFFNPSFFSFLVVGAFALIAIISLLGKYSGDPPLLMTLAMEEEKVFRAGAEHWTNKEKIKAASIFGIAHIFNLFIPLSIIPGLAILGVLLTRDYTREYQASQSRREALRRSQAVHTAYNRVAVGTVSMYLLFPHFLSRLVHLLGGKS